MELGTFILELSLQLGTLNLELETFFARGRWAFPRLGLRRPQSPGAPRSLDPSGRFPDPGSRIPPLNDSITPWETHPAPARPRPKRVRLGRIRRASDPMIASPGAMSTKRGMRDWGFGHTARMGNRESGTGIREPAWLAAALARRVIWLAAPTVVTPSEARGLAVACILQSSSLRNRLCTPPPDDVYSGRRDVSRTAG